MGKGIAVVFRDTFGRIEELRRQAKGVGEVAALSYGECKIYYLITKARYFNKPTYADLEQSLRFMRQDMESAGMRKLAMPLIGCGLDLLEWVTVKSIIEKTFVDSNIDVLVCRK